MRILCDTFNHAKKTPLGLTINPNGVNILNVNTIKVLQVVAEMPEYIKQATICMDEQSRESFINYIAENPLEGNLIMGTGGARKIRWTSDSHQGKRGGVRIIYYYYYHDQKTPIFLFTVYGKNKKETLSPSDKSILRTIIHAIVAVYRGE